MEQAEDGYVHLQACLKQCTLVIEKLRQFASTRRLGSEAEDLRELSLTLATVDNALYAFVCKLMLDAGQSAPRRNADLVEALNGMRRRLAATPNKTLPLGGIVSMLFHILSALEDTSAVLEDLRTRRRVRLLSILKTTIAALLLIAVHRGYFLTWAHQKLRRSLAVVGLAALAYRSVWSHSIASRNIQASNHHLLILLRMWTLCQDVYGQANMSKSRSYPTLMAAPADDDYEEALKPQGRRLLEQISLPQSSAVWISRSSSLVLLRYALEISYSCMYVGYSMRKRQWLRFLQWPATVVSGVYYTLRPSLASARALELTKASHLPFIKYIWSYFDCTAMRVASSWVMPGIETFKQVKFDGVDCHVFADFPLSENAVCLAPVHYSGTLNATGDLAVSSGNGGDAQGSSNQFYRLRAGSGGAPFLWRSSSFSRLAEWREQRHESITEEPDEDQGDDTTSSEGDAASSAPEVSSIPNEISANTTPRDLEPPPTLPASSSVASAQSLNSSSDDGAVDDDVQGITSETKVLLYIHGGGFVASLFPNDALLLARWAKQEDIVIVFVHYSLAPEARYPVALNECLRVYKWLRTHTSKIVVTGESAGGNLATALVLRCIQEGIPKPLHLSLAYPALDVNHCVSTSRAVHMNDPCLPSHLLSALAGAYIPVELAGRPIQDECLSPSIASDTLLREFPSTSIVVGGLDPLLDDAIELHARLRRVHVPVQMKVFRNLPHGFMGASFLPVTRNAVEAMRQWSFAPLVQSSSLISPSAASHK